MIQVDIEMPQNCYNCPMLYDGMGCIITGEGVDWNDYDKKRLDTCPVKEKKKGHWIHSRCDMYECSECGRIYTSFEIGECDAEFCPHCGADMRGDDDAR